MLSFLDAIAVLLTVTAAFAWLNHRLFRLPKTIGLLVMGLAASLLLVGAEIAFPEVAFFHHLVDQIQEIDFSRTLLDGMLAFLLFAGALHVDFSDLRSRAWIVGLMATVGVVISTVIVAVGTWAVAQLFAVPLPFAWALVFGALISPTDPVAVLSTLKAVHVPKTLETDMTGESLFNDGVGVVLFAILVAVAVSGTDGGDFPVSDVARLFFVEAVGGGMLGLVTGYVAYRAMRAIDEYTIEVLISLALVVGSYVLAQALHVSGPIAVVAAGLLVGNRGAADAMSDTTQEYLFAFWELIDEMLNSLLFLLIGLEVLVLQFVPSHAWVALLAIPIVLLARYVAVAAPVFSLRAFTHFVRGTVPVLTWGGIRGGISIALALSLPIMEHRSLILAATYAVALFTIVVQGLTLAGVARRACATSS